VDIFDNNVVNINVKSCNSTTYLPSWKRLLNKERMKNNIKAYESKACFCLLTILQHLPSYSSYHHGATTLFYILERRVNVPANLL
jgi:hypothetical protein